MKGSGPRRALGVGRLIMDTGQRLWADVEEVVVGGIGQLRPAR